MWFVILRLIGIWKKVKSRCIKLEISVDIGKVSCYNGTIS